MPPPRKLTDADLPAVKRMFAAGDSDEQMGVALGCGEATVRRFRIGHGLKRPRGNPNFARGQRKDVSPPPPIIPESTYEENGRTIIKLPPGVAHGIVPEPTARVKQKRRRSGL
jgi:hypothetical protein